MRTAVLLLCAAIPFSTGGCGTRAGTNIDAAAAATTDACQHTCTPDPLPPLVNCAASEAGLEFFDAPAIWTFEEDGTTEDPENGIVKKAVHLYSYTDESEAIRSFVVYDTQKRETVKKTWEPPVTQMDRCAGTPPGENHAIHVQGGPFLAWGGGIGTSMKDYPVACTKGMECVGRDPAIPTFDATTNRIPDSVHATLNFSEWEGVSFWGRRGPDSQIGLRVIVGDRFTDDDVNFLMFAADPLQPRYCERVRECACPDHKECLEQTKAEPITSACVNSSTMNLPNPATGMPVVSTYCGGKAEPRVGGAVAEGSSVQCNSCDRNHCNEEWPAYPGHPDPAFLNRPCLPYTLKNGVSSSFCFDPALGELPADNDQQCGDHWTKTVALTNEWQFFTVPFSSMTQQGWAKHTTKLDLTNLSLVRFTWDGGWIDVYLDDVRFYRHAAR
jgi:hypothetical protein